MDIFWNVIWPILFAPLCWYAAASSAYRLVQSARTRVASLVTGYAFDLKKEPFEFWFLTICRLIVVPGVISAMVTPTGISPRAVVSNAGMLWRLLNPG